MYNNMEDRDVLLQQIDRILNEIRISNVIFAFDQPLPEEPVDIPLWSRFITVLDGCKNMIMVTQAGILPTP